jgi:Ion channel
MSQQLNTRGLRRAFRDHLFVGLRVVWPILTLLLLLIAALGCVVALFEHWSLFDGVYFAFVTGLTIGYGDLAPKTLVAKTLAVGIGFVGILLGGLVAAVGVQALHATAQAPRSD